MLHNCTFHSKSEMVWYFIGVYTINRTLHGCLEIQHLSSRVEKYFMSQHNKHSGSKKFCISLRMGNSNLGFLCLNMSLVSFFCPLTWNLLTLGGIFVYFSLLYALHAWTLAAKISRQHLLFLGYRRLPS